jgi:hypothetical protein
MENINEKLIKHESMLTELWKEFFPMIIQTAVDLSFEYKILEHDGVQDGIQFYSPQSDNTFWMIINVKDSVKEPYFRFLGKICYYNDSTDLFSILSYNDNLGTSMYILPPDMKFIALKYDQPFCGGFPEKIWFEYILCKFDNDLNYFQNKFNN